MRLRGQRKYSALAAMWTTAAVQREIDDELHPAPLGERRF